MFTVVPAAIVSPGAATGFAAVVSAKIAIGENARVTITASAARSILFLIFFIESPPQINNHKVSI
jgi:hypothetical protein